jgi:C1A family cysteine protease
MFSPTLRTAAVTLLLAGTLAGCSQQLNAAGSRTGYGASALAKKVKVGGLGCNLDGLKPLGDDEPVAQGLLPTKVDLRAGCSPISNQGQTNACVGFATVDGLLEFVAKKQNRPVDLAPRFIWTLGRKKNGNLGKNVGMWPSDAMKIADNQGVLPESAFPFPTDAQQADEKALQPFLDEVPNSKLMTQAKDLRLIQGFKPVQTVHAMKRSVADGVPVVFAIAIYKSIGDMKADNVIPLPKPGEEMQGGHAILCVGYDNAKRVFLIRNSWGTGWGDKGYAYLPYDFMRGHAYEGFTAKL